MSFAEFVTEPQLAPVNARVKQFGPFSLLVASLLPGAHYWPPQYQTGRRRWRTRFFELRTNSLRRGFASLEFIAARWRCAFVYYVPVDAAVVDKEFRRQHNLQAYYDKWFGWRDPLDLTPKSDGLADFKTMTTQPVHYNDESNGVGMQEHP